MDKTAVSPSDRLAQISLTAESQTSLALLRAVGFRLDGADTLSFLSREHAADILGGQNSDLPATLDDWTSRLAPEDRRERRRAISRLTWDGAQYRLTYRWRTVHGDDIWIEERGERRSGNEDRPVEVHGVFRNVTAEHCAQKRAQFLTNHDELTELLNRDALDSAVTHMAALTVRQRGKGAFIRLRLANIDDINAVYGYETGDRMIAEFARRLAQIIRQPDVLGRIDGADFGIAVYDADLDAVSAMAERLIFLLENAPVPTPHGGLYGEVKLSTVLIPAHAQTAQDAMSRAEIALRGASASTLCVYSPTMGTASNTGPRETTADDILDALNQRRIRLAYQPIIDTKTRQLHHYECLLRLRREDGEIISAGRFIMAAEKLGLVNLLDRRALELAAETLAEDPELHLALNVSAATVKDPTSAADYLNALKALGPAAARVTIELTETVALDDPAMASAFSNSVRDFGCEFAIDDFGSGYTTFRNLMAIEADMIKIDGTLIEGIATDPNKQTFVRMMVDLAQTFSVSTVAEMVDSRADAEVLRRLGVDYLQGFMFGVPSAAPSWQKRAG